jgi:hypothetical protein
MGHCHEPVDTHCVDCELPQMERNHYFTGKLLVERDFTDEQRYTMGKLRRHDLRLHGHGVVCGLKVTAHPNPSCQHRYVIVSPGTALDCCGREILVPREEPVDVLSLYLDAWRATHGADATPDATPRAFQLAIRYRECPTEPMPALFSDCGCDDAGCQPNRIHESYEFVVVTDPATHVDEPDLVTLDWEATLNLAGATHVVAGDKTIFVAAASTPDTVYAVDPAHGAVLHAQPFTGLAVAQIALSSDGQRLFALLGGGTDPALQVLDATDLSKPPLNTQAFTGAAIADLHLAAGPDGRLHVLDRGAKRVSSWAADIAGASPAAPAVFALPDAPDAIAVSPDGRYAFVAAGDTAHLHVVDTSGAGVVQTIDVGSGGTARPRALAAMPGGDGPNVALLDAANQQLFLVGWRPGAATPAARAPVLAAPLGGMDFPASAVVSAGGSRWLYLLETDAATKRSAVQALDTHAWILAQPTPFAPAVLAGTQAGELAASPDGRRLFVAYAGTGGGGGADPGGVAVLDVKGGDCDAIFARSLEGCAACTSEFEVLARVSPYTFDTPITAPTIDNLVDRRLLPSTDAIVEVVKCLLANCCGGGNGGTGPMGPPGPGVDSADAETVPAGTSASASYDAATRHLHFKIPAGADGLPGTPGTSVKTADAEDVPNGQPADASFNAATGNVHFKIPAGQRGADGQDGVVPLLKLPHVVGLNWTHHGLMKFNEAQERLRDGLLVVFDRAMWAETLNPQTVKLMFGTRTAADTQRSFDTTCWCEVACEVHPAWLDTMPHCGGSLPSDIKDTSTDKANGVRIVPMRNEKPAPFVPGTYRVVLEGDQILGREKVDVPDRLKEGQTVTVYPALDGNHLGPGLTGPGSRFKAPELQSPRCPTGDLAEGGAFLSWFSILD